MLKDLSLEHIVEFLAAKELKICQDWSDYNGSYSKFVKEKFDKHYLFLEMHHELLPNNNGKKILEKTKYLSDIILKSIED